MDTFEVYTWREGLLARVGHDLCIRVGEAKVEHDGDTIVVTVSAESLHVVGAMRDRDLDRNALSAKDRADIDEAIRAEVLHAWRHPTIVFRGGPDGRGTLTLHGVERPLTVRVRVSGGRAAGEVELKPSAWGIAPYRALLGTLRLQDRVKVRFDVAV